MNDLDAERHRLTPGKSVRISDLPTGMDKEKGDKSAGTEEFAALQDELAEWQAKLYAENKQKLLVVIQALDAAGKDGTVQDVFQHVHPQGLAITSFKVPSEVEMAHDYLWRVHQVVPAKRMIGIFNRSQYEDVLVVRVAQIVPESVWQARYEQINQFEKLLADNGMVILKFFLHISKDEQRKRLQERMTDPTKQWKFSAEDVAKHKQYDQYMAAYEDVLNRCTTPWAPWYAIPTDHNWYRNLAVARVVVARLRAMNPTYPKPAEDWSGLTFD